VNKNNIHDYKGLNEKIIFGLNIDELIKI